ncbi:hypothetical protein ATW99_03905 [Oenococcus oeni]|uniref:hypothetical protein n=2 Tax=Oenococcus oeni TaxID=1247 RepID=UPI0008F9043B|nr:hypothetical protein [Oenococcus oeni]OIL21023.1 hypothetical protein ATW99_03905 [Oenococcus oeni]OIL42138.1 hypothetical protein ATX13_03885 [Oenococcus oeni]OIM55577.1 hypothetical protein ATX80_03575 [Oenococcus oeni]
MEKVFVLTLVLSLFFLIVLAVSTTMLMLKKKSKVIYITLLFSSILFLFSAVALTFSTIGFKNELHKERLIEKKKDLKEKVSTAKSLAVTYQKTAVESAYESTQGSGKASRAIYQSWQNFPNGNSDNNQISSLVNSAMKSQIRNITLAQANLVDAQHKLFLLKKLHEKFSRISYITNKYASTKKFVDQASELYKLSTKPNRSFSEWTERVDYLKTNINEEYQKLH